MFFAEECYDPFSPEVVLPEDNRNEEPEVKPRAGSPMEVGAMELELVNRAIQAVQCEVEREKRRLSHIGDQEYKPTANSATVATKRKKPTPVASHQGYDPGCYQMTQGADYSPTPRSNKYILDSESEDNHGSSLEYVPKTVSKTAKKSLIFSPTSRSSSLPSSPRSSTSVKCKYTLDTSKPHTDMEYDPLSNFSAKLASKNKGRRTLTTEAETKKASLPTSKRKQSMDEEYVPTVKKQRPQQPVVDSQKYSACFSESDGESSGMEYRPTLLSHMQRRKFRSASVEDGTQRISEGKGDITASRVLKQQRNHNSRPDQGSSHGESEDLEECLDQEQPREKVPEKKAKEKDSQKKSSKNGEEKREEKRSYGKSSSEKERTESSTRDKKKKLSSESIKKTDRTEDKNRLKDKAAYKSRKDDKSTDIKSKSLEKVKGESGHKDKERSSEVKKHKSDKTHEKDSSKHKDQKNGKLHSAGKERDRSKLSQGSMSSSKDKGKKSSLLSSSKETKAGRQKQRSLSHVDLFGDESGEGEEQEEEEEENIVRKSATAHRRTSLLSSKRDVVDLSRSSSEDEIGQEDDRSDYEDVDYGGVDYSGLQDVDYESDPLEECLRIFNESKDVKTEDKGRQAKQVPAVCFCWHGPFVLLFELSPIFKLQVRLFKILITFYFRKCNQNLISP